VTSALILERFHLVLSRVERDDIEVIRQGRNAEHVRTMHVYQDEITPSQQEAWFIRIDTEWNYFFVIHHKGKKVGVVYVSEFTPQMATSNCGVFIWDHDTLGTRVPLMAILTVLDFFFFDLEGGGTSSVVLRSNSAALRMNEFFGFRFEPGPTDELVRVSMDRSLYLEHRERLMGFARRAVKDPAAFPLRLRGAPSPKLFAVINERLAALSGVRGAADDDDDNAAARGPMVHDQAG
jgi:RimJ/RimL family protein N-acetyltransferase